MSGTNDGVIKCRALTNKDVLDFYVGGEIMLCTNSADDKFVDKGQMWTVEDGDEKITLFVYSDIDNHDNVMVVPITKNVGRSMHHNPVVLYNGEGMVVHADMLVSLSYKTLLKCGVCGDALTSNSRGWLLNVVHCHRNGGDHGAMYGSTPADINEYDAIRARLHNKMNILAFM